MLEAKANALSTKKIVLEDRVQQKQIALNERCWRWRLSVTEAKTFGSDESRLKRLLKEAADLDPNKPALASTGIGIVMSDQTLWPEEKWPLA